MKIQDVYIFFFFQSLVSLDLLRRITHVVEVWIGSNIEVIRCEVFVKAVPIWVGFYLPLVQSWLSGSVVAILEPVVLNVPIWLIPDIVLSIAISVVQVLGL